MEPKRYAHCTAVRPGQRIISEVANDPGGIGTISFSFLRSATGVRAVAVDGQQASVINFEYPISRPLYLLSREENGAVNAFVSWAQSEEGQQVVMQRFVGTRVVGSVKATSTRSDTSGTLIVSTDNLSGLRWRHLLLPHRSYDVLTTTGTFVRHVTNHRGENDEHPMRIHLPPGTYLIRADTAGMKRLEMFVEIETGKTTKADVKAFARKKRRSHLP